MASNASAQWMEEISTTTVFQDVMQRLAELKSDADAEAQPVSPESQKDLLSFLANCQFTRRPFIVLLDNGNLRILWKNAAKEQIGLQFCGNSIVQYVLFAKRSESNFMARSSGRDTLTGVAHQLKAHNLLHLMLL